MSSTTIQASEHPIRSVTLFKAGKAEVVRTFVIKLQKGKNKFEIKGLSGTLDTHSVRVSGLLGRARLLDVVPAVFAYAPESSLEMIQTLNAKCGLLQCEGFLRDHQTQALAKYGQTLNAPHLSPAEMSSFLKKFEEHGKQTLELFSSLNARALQVDRQILEIQEAMERGTAKGQVDLIVDAHTAGSVELKLTYIVNNVDWRPIYELHTTTENGQPSSCVSLHYRAQISQSTGENWNNVALTLSTGSHDPMVSPAPRLRLLKMLHPPVDTPSIYKNNVFANAGYNPLFAQSNDQTTGSPFQTVKMPFPSQPSTFPAIGGPPFGASAFAAAFGSNGGDVKKEEPMGLTAVPLSAAPQPSFGVFGGGQTTNVFPSNSGPAPIYASGLSQTIFNPFDDVEETPGESPQANPLNIPGASTIPSDGVEHNLLLVVLPLEAKISHMAIPRIDSKVYLQAEVENASGYRLLAGPINVIVDDDYVSKTSITTDVDAWGTFDCILGDDPLMKAMHSKSSCTVKSTGHPFGGPTNVTAYTTKITLHNRHPYPIKHMIVKDVVPTCDDERVQVFPEKPAGLADAKDGRRVKVKTGCGNNNPNQGLEVGWEKMVDGKGGRSEGRFEWRLRVGSGARVVLESQWNVKVPGELPWVEAFMGK